jgi:hypothetical protein
MDKDYLTLKRASASRPSGEWNDDDSTCCAALIKLGKGGSQIFAWLISKGTAAEEDDWDFESTHPQTKPRPSNPKRAGSREAP